MSSQSEPTEHEQEQPPERLIEEEDMRGTPDTAGGEGLPGRDDEEPDDE